jgi:malate dehydrogenase (quinone)
MKPVRKYDAFMIGSGIMSVTLAALLRELHPEWKMGIVEKNGSFPMESSNSLHNAGTGHSGFCELNYDLHKAIDTCEAFEQSKQFWAYLAKTKRIEPDFIHQVPHISFVEGQSNVDDLRKRYLEMKNNCLFADMEFSDDSEVLKTWVPLMMKDKKGNTPVAATRMKRGTDVDFGKLTSSINRYLQINGIETDNYREVVDIKKENEAWIVSIKKIDSGEEYAISTRFLFIGAGGASLTLLQKSGIPESKGYGGFPVSGQFLMCDVPEIVNQHHAKVYGKPEIGAPPMSVPHLDTRIIDGKKVLLFGPYAGFSTKFLKQGHWTDFFKALKLSNVFVIISAGLRNLGLSKYLVSEVTKTKKGRFETLLKYYPSANINDWKPIVAGQRVQVIKKDKGIPTIEFGTEVVTSEDHSIAALLGASPGASTSVHIMLELMFKCFGQSKSWTDFMYKLNKIIPSYGSSLNDDEDLLEEVERITSTFLKLDDGNKH